MLAPVPPAVYEFGCVVAVIGADGIVVRVGIVLERRIADAKAAANNGLFAQRDRQSQHAGRSSRSGSACPGCWDCRPRRRCTSVLLVGL